MEIYLLEMEWRHNNWGGGVRNLVLPNLEEETPQEGVEEDFVSNDEDAEVAFNQLQIDMNNNRQEEEEPEDPREVEKRRRNELEKERQRKELEELKLKWEARAKNLVRKEKLSSATKKQDILLEAVWIFQSAGIKDRQKRCSLALKKDHVNRELPNIHIINDSEKSDNFVNYCNKTIWSEERGTGIRFKGHKEGLWIRGEHEIVKKTVKVSWEDIRNSGFTKSKDRNDPREINDDLSELNESCRVARKINNENWTEITCLGK